MRSRLGSRHASPHAMQRPSVNRGRGEPCKHPLEAHQSTHKARAWHPAACAGAAPHESPQPAKAQRAKRVGNLHIDPASRSGLRQLATGQRDGNQAAMRHRAAIQRPEQWRPLRLAVGPEAQGLDITRDGHACGAGTAALRIHHLDPTRRPLPWRKPLCVDLDPIHECGGKLDCAATAVASGEWKQPKPPFIRPAKNRKPYTPSVADQYANRIDSPEKTP